MTVRAAMIWNEPNNKSHWDLALDPDWGLFARCAIAAGHAIKAANPALPRVLGGLSPIDVSFLQKLDMQGVMNVIDVLAVHGFPLDWNLWPIDDWPLKIAEVSAAFNKPIWVTEVGVSSFGSETVQAWGVAETARLLHGKAAVIHWYSLFDLPRAWEATTRHREAEGSSYYRHFYMGLVREDGSLKPAFDVFAALKPPLGICQWFHFEDERLERAVELMQQLGIRHVRTGLSWADSFRPNALDWFDKQMEALKSFDVTVTFCFTPEHLGLEPHHSSPPREPEAFAAFCAEMVTRYAPASAPAR